MGASVNKVFLPVAGKPILVYAVEALAQAREVGEIMLVAHRLEVTRVRDEIVSRYGLSRVTSIVVGGRTRHESEDHALIALRSRIEAGEFDVVLIHDGARPFVDPRETDLIVRQARVSGGAILATPVDEEETIVHLADDGSVTTVYTSGELWRAQTPQAFNARALLTAYDRARADGFEGTDTSATYERLGHKVHIVGGRPLNVKVTTPFDLLTAERQVRHGLPHAILDS